MSQGHRVQSNKDIDVAYQEVQAKLAGIRSSLPEDLEEPVVEELDVDAAPIMAVVISVDKPILRANAAGGRRNQGTAPARAQCGPGQLAGGRDRQFWIWIDPAWWLSPFHP